MQRPNGWTVGDKVMVKDPRYVWVKAEIVGFQTHPSELVKVKMPDGEIRARPYDKIKERDE